MTYSFTSVEYPSFEVHYFLYFKSNSKVVSGCIICQLVLSLLWIQGEINRKLTKKKYDVGLNNIFGPLFQVTQCCFNAACVWLFFLYGLYFHYYLRCRWWSRYSKRHGGGHLWKNTTERAPLKWRSRHLCFQSWAIHSRHENGKDAKSQFS